MRTDRRLPLPRNLIGAILNTVFAYGQVMAVFSFLPEMKRPNDFKKSMLLSQTISLVIYTVVGAVCYRYAGQYVTSPALSMTSRTVECVAYAFALVTIIGASETPESRSPETPN